MIRVGQYERGPYKSGHYIEFGALNKRRVYLRNKNDFPRSFEKIGAFKYREEWEDVYGSTQCIYGNRINCKEFVIRDGRRINLTRDEVMEIDTFR